MLNGTPVLMHTIRRFYEYDSRLHIILVLAEKDVVQWQELVSKFDFKITHSIAFGGAQRHGSVRNGLKKLNGKCIVAIHDGARPLCTKELIKKCFESAEKNTNAVPAI